MYRGTALPIQLNLDTSLNLEEAEALYVTFSNGYKKIDCGKERVSIDGQSLIIELGQSDTLFFAPGDVEVQVRFKMPDGRVYASDIASIDMQRILKDGVI